MEYKQRDKQGPMRIAATLRETEQACMALIETEIEIAFSFLRLAEVETCGGNHEHATELIAKALVTHNVALKYIQNMRPEFAEEKSELCRETRRLFEAVRDTERHRRQSSLEVLTT